MLCFVNVSELWLFYSFFGETGKKKCIILGSSTIDEDVNEFYCIFLSFLFVKNDQTLQHY